MLSMVRLRMKRLVVVLGGFLFWATFSSPAAGPGDEVVVVYNSRLPESKAIAEHYAQKRQVPPEQIFGFDLSTGEEMTRGEYQHSLQYPLAKAIKDHKLWHFETQVI